MNYAFSLSGRRLQVRESLGLATPSRARGLALLTAVGLLFGATTKLSARERSALTVNLSAQRVFTDSRGQELLLDELTAQPGDVLQYRAVYLNSSRAPLFQLAPTLPIPRGTEYIPGSATPEPVEGSLDGTSFRPLPLFREVRLADGSSARVEVPARELRALRWGIGQLAAQASAVTTARVRIVWEGVQP